MPSVAHSRNGRATASSRGIAIFALAVVGCATVSGRPTDVPWPIVLASQFGRMPDTVPTRWVGLIGEYGEDTTLRWTVLERERRLWVLDHRGNYVPLAERNDSVFDAPIATAAVSGEVSFSRTRNGRATTITVADMVRRRHTVGPEPGASQLRITPVRPIEELRRAALTASPPAETGMFLTPELVELTTLDSTIRLDIRYAGANNFLGTKLYEEPRAFMQRPAAEALVRAHRVMKEFGFGLLVHDAYRPWYVTKVFWDATPDSVRWLVANPAQGSKHNRGAAVDVTLYDLETGKVIDMTSTYDESTYRARANYPGGTSLQRWHRGLMRQALEHEGFVANPLEWWHFDYKDWKSYQLLNLPFNVIPSVARDLQF
jgi:D-alanyl-D-alanine dipeptidase